MLQTRVDAVEPCHFRASGVPGPSQDPARDACGLAGVHPSCKPYFVSASWPGEGSVEKGGDSLNELGIGSQYTRALG